jgi:hypothetical protein
MLRFSATPTQLRLLTIIHVLGNGESFSMEYDFTAEDRQGDLFPVEFLGSDEHGILVSGTAEGELAPGVLVQLAKFLERKYGKFTRVTPHTVVGVSPATGIGYHRTVFVNTVDEAANRVLDTEEDLLIAAVYQGFLPWPMLANVASEPYLPTINQLVA